MKKWKIVCDSSCNLREIADLPENITFEYAPLSINVGEQIFRDDDDLNVREMIDALAVYEGKSGSACPSPGDWADAFKDADYVFAITITGGLSGSYSSAHAAVDMIQSENSDSKIFLIDSLSTGPAMTLLTYKLIEFISSGMEYEKICEEIMEYFKHVDLFFSLGSLDNLVKNGRVGKLEGKLAGILGIRVVGIASEEGKLDLLHKCRGKLKPYDIMIKDMKEKGYCGGKVVISHCFNEEMSLYIKNKLLSEYPNADIEIMPTTGLCSYYAEETGILVGFEHEI